MASDRNCGVLTSRSCCFNRSWKRLSFASIRRKASKARPYSTAEEFVVLMRASVAGSAVAALGRERACQLVATQLAALEML